MASNTNAATGETDLRKFVFTTVSPEDRNLIPNGDVHCEVKEVEGVTLVLEKNIADKYNNFVKYEKTWSWIQLEVHSSLAAVGLTAAFSTALAKANLSCNVMAGFYHDHIFVDVAKTAEAMQVLRRLSKEY